MKAEPYSLYQSPRLWPLQPQLPAVTPRYPSCTVSHTRVCIAEHAALIRTACASQVLARRIRSWIFDLVNLTVCLFHRLTCLDSHMRYESCHVETLVEGAIITDWPALIKARLRVTESVNARSCTRCIFVACATCYLSLAYRIRPPTPETTRSCDDALYNTKHSPAALWKPST